MALSHPQLVQLLLLAMCAVHLTLGQTFHYSNGWTNGKRSGMMAKAGPVKGEEARVSQIGRTQ